MDAHTHTHTHTQKAFSVCSHYQGIQQDDDKNKSLAIYQHIPG